MFTEEEIVEWDKLCRENPSSLHALKEVYSCTNTSVSIEDCYTLIDLVEELSTLKFETLSKNYNEVSLDIDYLHTLIDHEDKLSIFEQSSFLLVKSHLGNALDIDEILNEIIDHKVEMSSREEDIVFYTIDGDEVDYFFMNSFKPEVDFIFPSNAFDPHVNIIKEEFKFYATLVVDVLDFRFASPPRRIVCLLAPLFYCLSRRRTKGRLAQTFDSYD